MSDPLNICLSCGLCCDGTLIGFVQLGSEELPALREIMDIEEANGEGFFIQPCNKYSDGCSIYSQRAKQCIKFECGLLKSFDQKELNFDSAIKVIDEVNQRKTAIEKKVATQPFQLKSPSFYFRMTELNILLKKIKSESTLSQSQLELVSDLKQLDSLVLKYFGILLYKK